MQGHHYLLEKNNGKMKVGQESYEQFNLSLRRRLFIDIAITKERPCLLF